MAYIIVDTDKLRQLVCACVIAETQRECLRCSEREGSLILSIADDRAIKASTAFNAYLEAGESAQQEGPTQS